MPGGRTNGSAEILELLQCLRTPKQQLGVGESREIREFRLGRSRSLDVGWSLQDSGRRRSKCLELGSRQNSGAGVVIKEHGKQKLPPGSVPKANWQRPAQDAGQASGTSLTSRACNQPLRP